LLYRFCLLNRHRRWLRDFLLSHWFRPGVERQPLKKIEANEKASVRNVRTCRSDAKEEVSSGQNRKDERCGAQGTEQLVLGMKAL
jgi:hypothetical protein